MAFQRGESGSLPELKLVVENNRYSYSTPSRCSPAAFQPADLSHLTLGGNSPFALSVSPRPLAAKLLNLEHSPFLSTVFFSHFNSGQMESYRRESDG